MPDETKRADIYEYLDKKFGEIYTMQANQGSAISDVQRDVAILKNREQPSSPCRSHIDIVRVALEEKDSALKYEMTALASGLHKKTDKCVSKWTFGYFITGISLIIGTIAGWLWDLTGRIK